MTQYFATETKIQKVGSWREKDGLLATERIGSALWFSFWGDTVRFSAVTGPEKGAIGIDLDGVWEGIADCYRDKADAIEVVFEKKELSPEKMHHLRLVNAFEKNGQSQGFSLEIKSFTAKEGVDYPAELKRQQQAEYQLIQKGEKDWQKPETWKAVPYRAVAPTHGVRLQPGLVRTLYDHNIRNIKYCFSLPDYCEGNPPDFVSPEEGGHGWSRWLPGSNEGRLLAGAAWALCSEEDEELRGITDQIVADIKARMREDGYYNYYPEADSYARVRSQEQIGQADPNRDGVYSERKNYDRVFWTRGLLAAHEAGHPDALLLARRMYDWFNAAASYLPHILEGGNATNGTPGGPLLYHTPLGKSDDLITSERFFDQDYWFRAFQERQPMAFSHYPGERPHCYDLLQLEALADEYRATGNEKYRNALLGAWDIYFDHYKHIGGATAICEMDGPYPPQSYYLTTGHNGETCGSVFWIWINHRLTQLYPKEEKYAAEIEEAILNVLCAARTESGYTRYHNRLHGKKEEGKNENTCCEVSSTMLISAIPQYLYLTDDQGVIVNQYFASRYEGEGFTLHLDSNFPEEEQVTLTLAVAKEAKEIDIRLRIPSWLETTVTIQVNGNTAATGKPGSYVSLKRIWHTGDTVTVTLPFALKAELYTGVDQEAGNRKRYAVQYGPVLLALTGDFGTGDIPVLRFPPEEIAQRLERKDGLSFAIDEEPEKKFVPYYAILDEPFTCFPILKS